MTITIENLEPLSLAGMKEFIEGSRRAGVLAKERKRRIFGKAEYEPAAKISVSHIYNLRGSESYRSHRVWVHHTQARQVSIAERRKPDPQGRPGCLRVDTVRQGNQDGKAGLYHSAASPQIKRQESKSDFAAKPRCVIVILFGGFTVPKALRFAAVSLALAAGTLLAAEFPQAEISNRSIQARLYLPDPERGYYRATRFDWSGIIYSLRYAGHEYFGQWFERHDPKIHDAITGPVEEFRTQEAGLGYQEAKPGETFIRIGVGVVRKPAERAYRPFNTYDMVDPGKWTVRQGRDWIEFIHELKDQTGYAYVYRKRVRLVKNKPELVLEHSLKNTGRRLIETLQYNHNFFVIDSQPTGPDYVVRFPFPLRATSALKDTAQVRAGQLVYLRELKKGESVFTELAGFGNSRRDYDIRIENRKAGAGIRITGDQPLAKLYFWSIRTTLCPEPYIQMRIPPGRQSKWKIAYQFYTLAEPRP